MTINESDRSSMARPCWFEFGYGGSTSWVAQIIPTLETQDPSRAFHDVNALLSAVTEWNVRRDWGSAVCFIKSARTSPWLRQTLKLIKKRADNDLLADVTKLQSFVRDCCAKLDLGLISRDALADFYS